MKYATTLSVTALLTSVAWVGSLALPALCRATAPPPAGGEDAARADAAARRAAASSNAFGADLYRRLAAAEKGNLSLSPWSIESALAMTYGGAKGQTAEQMARVLHLEGPADQVQTGFGALTRQLNESADTGIDETRAFELEVACALWAQRSSPVNADYLKLLGREYGATLETLNFAGGPAALDRSRREINVWVESRTHDRIKDLLAPGALDASTRLVLTDAIYFKARWEQEFDASATRDEPFHAGAGTDRNVPMMHRSGLLSYAADENVQTVLLNYAFGRLSMAVLLPRKADGLAALEKSLSAKQIDDWLLSAEEREVELSLPKFRFQSHFDLAGTLGAMGMSGTFGEGADFSGISASDKLFLQSMVHQAFVDVHEEGTEAAAATVVAVGAAAVPVRPMEKVVLRVDHPFLFVIRNNATGAILFLGRVSDPTAGG